MHKDSHEVLNLDWTLDLSTGTRDALAYRAALRGHDEFTLFEGSYHHMYLRTLAIITSVYLDSIQMMHDDGEFLHVYLKKNFTSPQLSMLRRVFDTKMYKPDICLNDILSTGQAVLSVRERSTQGVTVTRYETVESYEGPLNDDDVREVAESTNMQVSDICCMAYRVVEVQEEQYDAPPVFNVITANGSDFVDFQDMAVRCLKDRLYAIRELSKVERYLKRSGR